MKRARRLAELDAALDLAVELCRRSALRARRAALLAQLTAAALGAASGCTFCVVHEESAFEASCRERGGKVHATTTSQICLDDDGGVP